MRKTVYFKTIAEYNRYMGVGYLHPAVTLVDYSKLPPILFSDTVKVYGFYVVFLKGRAYTALKYGQNTYKYAENELVFAAPNQSMASVADGKYHKVGGYALAFHCDFIASTHLGHVMQNYPFFSYGVCEALSINGREKSTILHSLKNIQRELDNPDKLSDTIILDNIKLILDNCKRFYNRQFDAEFSGENGILSRFEKAVDEYFDLPAKQKEPQTVIQYCAKKLLLSPSYLSRQIASQTGISALRHIHTKIMERAKEGLYSEKSVAQIAEELGFKYTQHFSRWFKNMEGISPNFYRAKKLK